MTSRERLVAAARGGDVDQRPVLLWPSRVGDASDARIVSVDEVNFSLENEPDKAVLAEIVGPCGRATSLALNALLESDPAAGNVELDRLVRLVRDDIQAALSQGADGVFYRLQGAQPGLTTPMQYGGFYLERDRELLREVKDARLNVLYVEGPGAYIDFVSDLPAHVFAWDPTDGSRFDEVRTLRPGALAALHPLADVLFAEHLSTVQDWIKPTGEWEAALNHG